VWGLRPQPGALPLPPYLTNLHTAIAGRVFEDEFALAMAIVAGMECRALQGQYGLERFIFT
jgi:hypothetical protein